MPCVNVYSESEELEILTALFRIAELIYDFFHSAKNKEKQKCQLTITAKLYKDSEYKP